MRWGVGRSPGGGNGISRDRDARLGPPSRGRLGSPVRDWDPPGVGLLGWDSPVGAGDPGEREPPLVWGWDPPRIGVWDWDPRGDWGPSGVAVWGWGCPGCGVGGSPSSAPPGRAVSAPAVLSPVPQSPDCPRAAAGATRAAHRGSGTREGRGSPPLAARQPLCRGPRRWPRSKVWQCQHRVPCVTPCTPRGPGLTLCVPSDVRFVTEESFDFSFVSPSDR